ncbi:MAG: integrase [Erysipelotrichaceae bacterium]|nr:integrase [Erysipelotrichaceae bacterium]
MKLDEALKEYLMHIRINEGKSRRTGISYEEDLKQYTAWLKEKGIKDTKKITSDLVEDFIVEQQKAKASASVVRMASSIRSFHRDLAFMHDEKDPSLNLEVHKDTKRLPVFCTVDEINRLMSSFDDEDPKQYLDHAILEMIYACGLRVSEVTTLTLNRVDLDAGKCRVLGKGDKERIVPIPDGSVAFLKGYRDIVRPVYLKGRSNLFFLNRFGRRITSKYVENLLVQKCNELNFKKHITPHKLRHSYATHMLQGGADLRTIQEILGHSNIATTEIYTHVQNRQLFDSYEMYHPGGSDLNTLKRRKKEE